MKIVIDANRIIASLIKDGDSRKILLSKNFDFISPDHALSEIYKYEEEIMRKADINHEEFKILFSLIFENISVISEENYKDYLEKARKLIEDIDDVPFIAVYLALKADGIWSDDSHFIDKESLRIFRTQKMLEFNNAE